MAHLTEYDERQAANRLRVPITAYRWAVHAGIVPAPEAHRRTWARAAVEAMDAEAIKAAIPVGPISGWQAAQRIAEALGTPNEPGQPAAVRVFTVRRLVALGMLTDLSGHPEDLLVHPNQVADLCTRPGLAELVAAEAPLGPDQAAKRLGVRRAEFDHMVRLRWANPAEYQEVRFGTSRAGAVDVPLFRTGAIDALPDAHPEIDWAALRSVGKGRRSPLAALKPEPETAPAP